MKKKLFLLSLMFAAAITASATITKTIGTGGTYDYASLHDACMDLYANPLTDDCIWEICTDLTETINAGIINNTEYSLTIRPNAAESRTITYTTTADNEGPSGNVIIGGIPKATQAVNIPFATEPAKNVTIDGSYDGDGIRHLTITSGTVGGVVVVIYGDVTNSAVKNCILTHTRTSSTTYVMQIRTEKSTDNHPVGFLLENCYLQVTGVTNAQAIYFNGSQSSTAAGKPENTTIKDCEIVSNLRGVFLNGAKNVDFIGCTFRLPSASAGFLAHGIMGNAQSGVFNVKGCKFLELKTNNVSAGDYGIQGITASGGATVWNIENNIFTGLDALASGAASKAIKLCAVRCGDPCVVRHNTFVMPTLTYHPATTAMSSAPISLLYLAGSTNTVQNNIFISHETTSENSLIRGAMNAQCTGNKFYHDGGNAYAVAGAALCQDWAAVETNYPAQAATCKWKAVTFDANMMLDGTSITDNDLAVTQVAGITTDILGNTRNNPTYAGAEDPDQLTGFAHHLYEIGDNQGWDTNAGVEMTMVEPNVFQGEFTFTNATSYFTLAATLGTWDEVNAARYGADNSDEPITNGGVKALNLGWTNSFAIPAGKYRITADLNAMTVTVKQLWDNIYMFSDITGDWVLGDGVALTKTAENVFELDECEIPEGKYIIFSTTHGTDWPNVNAGRLYPESVGNFWVDGDGYASISATPDDDRALLVKAAGKYAFTIDLNEGKIFYTQTVAKLDVSDAGYATYYNSAKAYTMPEDMTGYAFNVDNGLVEAYAAGAVVPADFPLVLAAVAGTYDLVFTEGGTPVDLASQLLGTDADAETTAPTAGEYKFYGLSLDTDGSAESVGFYYMVENGAAFTNGAHKAYLAVPVAVGVAPRYIFNGENNATGVENLEANEQAVKFIENGKLYIRKNGVVYDAKGAIVR